MNKAISFNFLLRALIVFCCPHPGWTTHLGEMAPLEVKMIQIMDRMTRIEAEMVAKDQRIAFLEADKETKDHKIAVLEEAIEIRDIKMEEEMKSLTGRMDATEETDVLLRGIVDQVRNPPFAFQCAWQDGWETDNSVITYDRLTYDEISGGSIYNVTGGLDINTGVFTVGQGFSGTWEISYTIWAHQASGDINKAWLYINGELIGESVHYTEYGDSDGSVNSLGSRSLYMRLESGDTISLRTGGIRYLKYITVCFQLAQFDYVPPM